MSTRLEKRPIAKIAAYTIKPSSGDRSGLVFTNRGATGSVTFTLPTPNAGVKGWWYEFFLHADQSLIVAGAAAGAIAVNGNAAANNVSFEIASKKIGGRIIAMCDGTQWLCFGIRPGGGFCVNGTEVVIDDSVTAGTAAASRAVVLDVNKAVDGMTLGQTTKVTFGTGSVLGTLLGTLGITASQAGVGNGADATDDTLQSVTIKANSLNAVNKAVSFQAFGSLGATANNKTIKVFLGATTIATTGVITTNGGSWFAWGLIVRTAAGAQTIFACIQVGLALIVATITAGALDETTDLLLKVTGASPTSSAANDVKGNALAVDQTN